MVAPRRCGTASSGRSTMSRAQRLLVLAPPLRSIRAVWPRAKVGTKPDHQPPEEQALPAWAASAREPPPRLRGQAPLGRIDLADRLRPPVRGRPFGRVRPQRLASPPSTPTSTRAATLRWDQARAAREGVGPHGAVRATRMPSKLVRRLSRSRAETRRKGASNAHAPPRSTRKVPEGGPSGSVVGRTA